MARLLNTLFFTFFIFAASGCDLVEDVFKAGIWFTILAIVIIAALIYVLLTFSGRKPVKEPAVLKNEQDGSITHT